MITRSAATGVIAVGSGNGTDALVLNGGGTERVRIATNGNVGIGTTSPQTKLQVTGGSLHVGAQSFREPVIQNGIAGASAPSYSFWAQLDAGMYLPAANTLAFSTVGTERLRIASSGNIGIGTNAPVYPLEMASGAYCSAAGVWTSVSDRNVKENFTTITPGEVLAKVVAMPITQWKYKIEPSGIKHIGPVAQDFHAAFGLGDSDKAIGSVDESGVALAAIQGLNEVVKEKDSKINDLEKRLAAIEKTVQTLTANK